MNHISRLNTLLNTNEIKICILGLGYVGLPLAVEFGKKYKTLGFDINESRLDELKNAQDSTLELTANEILSSKNLTFTCKVNEISDCNIYIVTVPTPIDSSNEPNLNPLLKASELVGSIIDKGDLVIYESTVYPGATEEDCIPLIEQLSKLKFNKDFYAGYSPERINPGDKNHTLTNILKVTSGSNTQIANLVDDLYKSIINAGTFKAASIKVAEAAKVIENTQRDINIGLINELSLIFNLLDIDTEEVLQAAGTKWNFLNFRPGLVGGHCIGVDPYYLTHKAQSVGFNPEMILAGRRVNDAMAANIATRLVKKMISENYEVKNSSILVLGLSFKENCPDLRNTKVVDLISELNSYDINVDCYDPWVNHEEAIKEYNLKLITTIEKNKYDAILIAVAHNQFKDMGINMIKSFGKKEHVIFDLKYIFQSSDSDLRL